MSSTFESFIVTINPPCSLATFSTSTIPLLEHLAGTTAITHTFAEVLDDMSTTYGNNDGFTLCGARTYTKVSLTSVDNGAPDDAIVSLDSASRTFTIQGTTNLHYGEYVVTYRA